MGIQEIIVTVLVISAAIYSIRKFIKQFTEKDGSCSSCSCEPIDKRFKNSALNTPVYKKVTH